MRSRQIMKRFVTPLLVTQCLMNGRQESAEVCCEIYLFFIFFKDLINGAAL